jgi:RNA polymerase sigma-70 factor (ECF subfamily)
MLAPTIDSSPSGSSEPPAAAPSGAGGLGGRDEQGWFDAVTAAHLPSLRARAGQLCRGHGDPDDIVQDALMRAFLARHQMKDPERARAWLLTIVTNTFLDSLRRRRARPGEVALDADPPEPEREDEAAWASLDLDDVRTAVDFLPDDVRDTYRMFALDGRNYAHIASALGVPKATVGTRILRARKRLRQLLMAQLGGSHVTT